MKKLISLALLFSANAAYADECTLNIDANINENTSDAFNRVMELLDEVEESRVRSIRATH